jgi:hypothetical protein
MTRHSFGAGLAIIAWLLFMLRGEIHNQMRRVVARLAPPKTNRPFQNFREATDPKRVRREYERIFPVRARKKFLWMRATTIAGVMCFLGGMALLLWKN